MSDESCVEQLGLSFAPGCSSHDNAEGRWASGSSGGGTPSNGAAGGASACARDVFVVYNHNQAKHHPKRQEKLTLGGSGMTGLCRSRAGRGLRLCPTPTREI